MMRGLLILCGKASIHLPTDLCNPLPFPAASPFPSKFHFDAKYRNVTASKIAAPLQRENNINSPRWLTANPDLNMQINKRNRVHVLRTNCVSYVQTNLWPNASIFA